MVTLQTFCKGDDQCAIQVCVFPVALLVSSPARITSPISVWRPDYNSTLVVLGALKDVTSFVPFNLSDLAQQIGIPCFAKADPLRKGCARNRQRAAPFSWSTLRQSVNAFDVPTSFNTQTRNIGIGVKTLNLLFQRH